MFVGNIDGGGAAGGYPHCGPAANMTLIFPDPGASVDQFDTDDLSIRAGPTGQCAGSGSTLSNYGTVGLQQTALRSSASASTFAAATATSASLVAPAGSTLVAGSSAPTATSAPSAATRVPSTATISTSSYATTAMVPDFVTVSVAPVAIVTVTEDSTSTTTSTTSTTSSTATASAPASSALAGQEDSSKPTPTGTGSGSSITGACTTEGMWNCIGGSSFQRCASGLWSIPQPMAVGTTCQAGQSLELKIAAKLARPRGDFLVGGAVPYEPHNNPASKPPPASTPPPPPPPGSGSYLAGACTPEGMWNCIGGSSFQQCASGSWSASQPVAAGTTCQAGQHMDLGIASAKPKRAIRFSDEHVHMREPF
jgi:hypothetical protein